MTKYAFNLGDLADFMRRYQIPYQSMIFPVLTDTVVDCEPGRMDGSSLVVAEKDIHGDAVTEVRIAAIIELLRSGMGRMPAFAKHELRIYRSKTGNGGWQRV